MNCIPRLSRVQRLSDIRDQIVRMLDADREADCGIENPYPLPDVGRYAGVRHARGQACERLRAAEADGEFENLQRIEKSERGGFAAHDVE